LEDLHVQWCDWDHKPRGLILGCVRNKGREGKKIPGCFCSEFANFS
jgi:hypothetical protein